LVQLQNNDRLKASHQNDDKLIDKSKGREGTDEIRNEMYSRICSFFGEKSFPKIRDAFVIVVGLGGVGSHAINMLVRSGVSKVRIIDFDQVTLSSLNRHSLASLKDVGQSKAIVLKQRLLDIAPWIEIEAITEMFIGTEAERLLNNNPTYVLDCIDDVNTKAELISYCILNNIKVLTSMGAGGKSDPTRLRVAQLSDCINDPLASKIKWKLKKKYNILPENVTAIFSNEKPCVNLLPLSDEQVAAPSDYGAVDYLRLRVMPVLGTSPAIFGQAMASKVLCELADKEYVPESCERMSKNLKHKLLQTCRQWEKKRFNMNENNIKEHCVLDDDDIEFIVGQIWGSRCAISGKRFGGHQRLVLMRWNRSKGPEPDNLVLMIDNYAKMIEDEEKNWSNNDKEKKENFTPKCFHNDILIKINNKLQWASTVVNGDNYNDNSNGNSPKARIARGEDISNGSISSVVGRMTHEHVFATVYGIGVGFIIGFGGSIGIGLRSVFGLAAK